MTSEAVTNSTDSASVGRGSRRGDDLAGDIAIRLDGLTKIFGPDAHHALALVERGYTRRQLLQETAHVLAVDRISLTIERGIVFTVMGLSGSGKSTLVRCINRLVEPTAGKVYVDGTDITALSRRDLLRLRSEKLAMVFQHYALLPHRNVLDNVAFGLELQGEPRQLRYRKAREALKQVGLEGWEERLPAELSGGMQQRVGLARALAVNTPILLMDEPFSGLDPLIRKEMQRELLALEKGLRKTIVFITHDLDEALTLGDQICVLRDGRIEQQGSPQEIILSPSSDLIRAFVRDVNFLKVLTVESVMETSLTVYELGGPGPPPPPPGATGPEAVFVVDSGGRYLGLLPREQFANAIPAGPQVVRRALSNGWPKLRNRTPLRDALEAIARPPFVVAVTDDEQRLVGAITRESVFAMLRRQRG